MEGFRLLLQNELESRCRRNRRYSLRAFARHLGIHHGSLSQILSGKRSLTHRTLKRLGQSLELSPEDLEKFIEPDGLTELSPLSVDACYAVSDWYHDAILELTRLKFFKPDHQWIAKALDISVPEVSAAVERLQRIGFLKIKDTGTWVDVSGDNTNNHLGDITEDSLKKYQRDILQRSMKAIDDIPRSRREHSSMMLTIDPKDIPEVKKRIKKFRLELGRFLQRSARSNTDLYDLAISFFPITNNGALNTSILSERP